MAVIDIAQFRALSTAEIRLRTYEAEIRGWYETRCNPSKSMLSSSAHACSGNCFVLVSITDKPIILSFQRSLSHRTRRSQQHAHRTERHLRYTGHLVRINSPLPSLGPPCGGPRSSRISFGESRASTERNRHDHTVWSCTSFNFD